MYQSIKYRVKTKIIELSMKNRYLDKIVGGIRDKRRDNRVNPNLAKDAGSVLELVRSSGLKLFPMFGTLLSIYRDGKFIYADDYDFALMPGEKLDFKVINSMANKGAKLVAFSLVGNDLVEFSFEYEGIRIDIFKLDYYDDKVCHRCPNFRTDRPKIDFSELTIKEYSTYFEVEYPKITFYFDEFWGFYIPENCEDIFERHYGLDWNIPKQTNFIDYKNYRFIRKQSFNVSGHHSLLEVEVMERIYD